MTVEWWQFLLALLTVVGTGIGMSVRFGYVVANTMSNTVNKVTLETDAKIGRVYERFDKYKDQMESNYVRRETCQLSHGNSAKEFSEVKEDLRRLNEKVDALLMRGQ